MSPRPDRYLVVSSDGHAGLHAADYRPYVDSKYHEIFDAALPIQIEATQRMSDYFLITDINEEWRQGRDAELAGAWDPTARDKVIDADGIVAEVLFPDGVTEMNAPPFGAGFSMPPEGTNAELMWAGCDAHNRFMTEFVQSAPERRIGLACIPLYWDVDLAVEKGCDAVEPDNVDAFLNRSGFEITADDQVVYLRWLADEAHARGLSIGLKNAVALVDQVNGSGVAVGDTPRFREDGGQPAPVGGARPLRLVVLFRRAVLAVRLVRGHHRVG